MNPDDQRAGLVAQDPFQRVCPWEDRRDLHPELGEGGGYLAADEPHAHHDRAPARLRLALDRIAFGDRPQVVDAWQLSAGYPQRPVLSAGRDQDLLIAQFLSRRQGQGVRRHDLNQSTCGMMRLQVIMLQ